MRLKTPINGEELKTHFTYNSWKYVLLVVAAVIIWSMWGDKKPSYAEDKKIEVYVMTSTTDSEIINQFLEPLWQEYVPEMESVVSYTVPILDEYSMTQYFFTRFYAGEGDIYFLTEDYFKEYAAQGCFLPLEELVANGTIQTGGADLQNGYIKDVIYNSDQEPVSTESHLYGIPLDSFDGYQSKIGLYNKKMFASIVVFNKNDENVIPFFNVLLQAGMEAGEDTGN